MALSDEMAYGLAQLINIQGGTILYTRVTTISNAANPAPNPPTTMEPVVNGLTLAGGSSINFRATIFTGRLLAGDKFTIAGDPTVYTISAPATSPLTQQTIGPVTFSPVLAANAADGAAVSFTYGAQYNIAAIITDYPAHLINGTSIQSKDHKVRFLASSVPGGIPPAIGDFVQHPDGLVQGVIRVTHMETQGVHYGWSVQVRS